MAHALTQTHSSLHHFDLLMLSCHTLSHTHSTTDTRTHTLFLSHSHAHTLSLSVSHAHYLSLSHTLTGDNPRCDQHSNDQINRWNSLYILPQTRTRVPHPESWQRQRAGWGTANAKKTGERYLILILFVLFMPLACLFSLTHGYSVSCTLVSLNISFAHTQKISSCPPYLSSPLIISSILIFFISFIPSSLFILNFIKMIEITLYCSLRTSGVEEGSAHINTK